MDIHLPSLLYTAQSSGKRAFMGAQGSMWSKNLASVFFQLAFFRPYCLAHPSFQVAKRLVED